MMLNRRSIQLEVKWARPIMVMQLDKFQFCISPYDGTGEVFAFVRMGDFAGFLDEAIESRVLTPVKVSPYLGVKLRPEDIEAIRMFRNQLPHVVDELKRDWRLATKSRNLADVASEMGPEKAWAEFCFIMSMGPLGAQRLTTDQGRGYAEWLLPALRGTDDKLPRVLATAAHEVFASRSGAANRYARARDLETALVGGADLASICSRLAVSLASVQRGVPVAELREQSRGLGQREACRRMAENIIRLIGRAASDKLLRS